jgi:hypothetical protein
VGIFLPGIAPIKGTIFKMIAEGVREKEKNFLAVVENGSSGF